ncbi:hypothetical protein ACQ4PT_036270 [Festuca glaucescens]
MGNTLPNITALVMSNNHFEGEIPASLANASSMEFLYLGNNSLSGVVPSFGSMPNLQVLMLHSNQLEAGDWTFFSSFANCTQLQKVNLGKNRLRGSFPASSVANLPKSLNGLTLRSNYISGTIPLEIGNLSKISLLYVDDNLFTGPIPSTLGQLSNLFILSLSHNKFSGEIPSSIEGNLLEGSIPQSLANLKGAKALDFSQNNLSGRIPEFLETFTSLQYLNMSFNNFEGPVPIGGVFANTSNVSVQGNALLCSNVRVDDLPRCSTLASKRSRKFIVPLLAALSAVVALALILGLVFLVFHILRKRRWKSSQSIGQTYMELKRLTYNDVSKATDSFSPTNIVGSGQYGIMYKGQLDGEDTSVAVKVFKLNQYGAVDSFISECRALQNIRHRNLVRVITACSTYDPTGNEFKALVFEYMAKGSLESRLHAKLNKDADLSLGTAICIAVDIAAALEYLHNQCIPPVVHCDMKPRNILFDDDDTAHVCDFGLARLIRGYSFGVQSNSTSILGPRGSIGYIAPGE